MNTGIRTVAPAVSVDDIRKALQAAGLAGSSLEAEILAQAKPMRQGGIVMVMTLVGGVEEALYVKETADPTELRLLIADHDVQGSDPATVVQAKIGARIARSVSIREIVAEAGAKGAAAVDDVFLSANWESPQPAQIAADDTVVLLSGLRMRDWRFGEGADASEVPDNESLAYRAELKLRPYTQQLSIDVVPEVGDRHALSAFIEIDRGKPRFTFYAQPGGDVTASVRPQGEGEDAHLEVESGYFDGRVEQDRKFCGTPVARFYDSRS